MLQVLRKYLDIIITLNLILRLKLISSSLRKVMDNETPKYRMICTLTFGDIYGQIIVWLIVIFISLATTLALWSSTRQIYALATVGIVLVLSLPFLLFAFVTTLLNHIEFSPIEEEEKLTRASRGQSSPGKSQKTATSAG